MQRVLALLVLALVFAGCSAPNQDRPGEAPAPPALWDTTSNLHIVEDPLGDWGSVVLLYPLKLSAQTTTSGNYSMSGPTKSGVSILLVQAEEPHSVSYRDHVWSRSEFAEEVYENKATGERRVTCFEADDNGACLLRHEPNPPYNWTIFDQDGVWQQGDYYLLFDLEVGGLLDLSLTFSAPVQLGAPLRFENATRRVSLDLFRADYMDVHRCANVGFCGSVVSGLFPLDLAGHDIGFLRLQGDSSAGAFLRSCLVPRETPECLDVIPVPPIAGTMLIHRGIYVIRAEHGPTSLSLDAGGAPVADEVRPAYNNFYLGGRFIVLDLPATFPS